MAVARGDLRDDEGAFHEGDSAHSLNRSDLPGEGRDPDSARAVLVGAPVFLAIDIRSMDSIWAPAFAGEIGLMNEDQLPHHCAHSFSSAALAVTTEASLTWP